MMETTKCSQKVPINCNEIKLFVPASKNPSTCYTSSMCKVLNMFWGSCNLIMSDDSVLFIINSIVWSGCVTCFITIYVYTKNNPVALRTAKTP